MDLLAPDFDVVRDRTAYGVDGVDEAVAETRRRLAGHPATPGTGGAFTVTREGYDARQVDAWRDAVRRELAAAAERREVDLDDPPELRGVPSHEHYSDGPTRSSYPAWVRLTALVIAVAVALFFVASYFV